MVRKHRSVRTGGVKKLLVLVAERVGVGLRR